MAFGKTVVLFSQFTGRLITEDSEPAANIRVERNWEWGLTGRKGSDETITDQDGRFEFPEITGSSLMALMPHEPSITQSIVAHGPSGSVLVYSANKKRYERDAELIGRSLQGPGIRLECRIDEEPNDSGPFWGTCKPID